MSTTFILTTQSIVDEILCDNLDCPEFIRQLAVEWNQNKEVIASLIASLIMDTGADAGNNANNGNNDNDNNHEDTIVGTCNSIIALMNTNSRISSYIVGWFLR